MTRRVALGGLLCLAVLAALVPLGRWERSGHVDEETRGMERILRLVGPLDQPALDAYRKDVAFHFDCLLYRRGENRFALEVCFDTKGRLVEAIDRRGSGHRIASLREEPQASRIRVDRRAVNRLLRRLGAPP